MRELPDSPGPTEVLGRAESEESHTRTEIWSGSLEIQVQFLITKLCDLGQLFNLSKPQFPSQ